MPTIDVRLPELGENIATATVIEVLVAPGQAVEIDQGLLALESEKAEFELPSPVAGTVREVLVKAGEEVRVGQVVARIETTARAAAEDISPAEPHEHGDEATPGSRTPAGKHFVEPEAPEAAAGKTEQAPAPEPSAPEPGQARVGKLEQAPARESGKWPARKSEAVSAVEPEQPLGQKSGHAAPASPSVRRLARELGIDISEVPAAGERLTAEDVYRYVRGLLARGRARPARAPASEEPVDVEPMSKVRQRTAERMSLAWATIPHVSHHDAADITELDRLRPKFAPRVEREGGKLTITAVLLKVLGSALRRFPKFNASVDMEEAAILYRKEVHIGVAVDTERGLLVPVVRDADRKNIVELARELAELSEAARSRRLTPDRLQGAGFTVTNLGGIGGRHFDPLINPPEVAVLGVSRARMEPVWNGRRFEPRLMLPLTLSYDHRLIDGADAARFLLWVCEALEEPFLMDLEGN
ncbi:MAG: branched-chain alpha-keto acid dehydrogenase subunit E2 [Candidatus Dadabacteria bacterium]|nr:MAG: branched-chain alpha-keto acid dehydrogenase subunit E2 [Candidatus Dadabacteria bacterium]